MHIHTCMHIPYVRQQFMCPEVSTSPYRVELLGVLLGMLLVLGSSWDFVTAYSGAYNLNYTQDNRVTHTGPLREITSRVVSPAMSGC